MRRLSTAVVVAAAAAGLFAAGRVTAPSGDSDYSTGFRNGWSVGIEEGRAAQVALPLPVASRTVARNAFEAGYREGADDVFGGYDGGWDLSRPYVITLVAGHSGITYRIATRDRLENARRELGVTPDPDGG
jgi:hypothetical protein